MTSTPSRPVSATVPNVSTRPGFGEDPPSYQPRTMYIRLNATQAKEVERGVWELAIPARDLTQAETAVLADLFPHCEREITEMLSKEALLEAILPPKP